MAGEVNLLVVDFDTDKYYHSQKIVISGSTCEMEVVETPSLNPVKSASADAENGKYLVVIVVVVVVIVIITAIAIMFFLISLTRVDRRN